MLLLAGHALRTYPLILSGTDVYTRCPNKKLVGGQRVEALFDSYYKKTNFSLATQVHIYVDMDV